MTPIQTAKEEALKVKPHIKTVAHKVFKFHWKHRYVVEATAYAPGCGDSGRGTATGIQPYPGVIAVYPPQIPLGSVGIMDGHHVYAQDTGRDITWNRVDIWMKSCARAIKFGRGKKVIYV